MQWGGERNYSVADVTVCDDSVNDDSGLKGDAGDGEFYINLQTPK